MMERRFLTPEQAQMLLPDKQKIHTLFNLPISLCRAEWDRKDIIERINEAYKIEITGPMARELGYGLAVYEKGIVFFSEILFIETDKERLDEFDPIDDTGNDEIIDVPTGWKPSEEI